MMYYSLLIKQESILYLNIAGFLLYVFYIGSYLLCAEEKVGLSWRIYQKY